MRSELNILIMNQSGLIIIAQESFELIKDKKVDAL
jgi:hypothetical protein